METIKNGIFTHDWVMDPSPVKCNFTNSQIASILKFLKEYFDKCDAEKVLLYSKIIKLLEDDKIIIEPK
jgi:hypothetical protein